MIWDNSEIKFWYRQNIILYIRKDIANRINVHNEYGKMINTVHPEMYMRRIKYPAHEKRRAKLCLYYRKKIE
jgi:hypothetical protein